MTDNVEATAAKKTLSQKDAVIHAVREVLGPFTGSAASHLDRNQRRAVVDMVALLIRNGKVTYSKDVTDMAAIVKYSSSLVSNHLRKAPELNGGITYRTKTPGVQAHKKDIRLLALTKLLNAYPDTAPERAEISAAIENRKSELKKV